MPNLLLVCLYLPFSSTLRSPLRGGTFPRLGRTFIVCRDVPGDIRAIASSPAYDQCMATASGTYAYCDMNPIYAFQRQGGQLR